MRATWSANQVAASESSTPQAARHVISHSMETDRLERGDVLQMDRVNGSGGLLSGMCFLIVMVPSSFLFFVLIVTEPPLAGHFHYVNQECLLQDTMVGTHIETLSIQDDMGFGGMSSEFLAC